MHSAVISSEWQRKKTGNRLSKELARRNRSTTRYLRKEVISKVLSHYKGSALKIILLLEKKKKQLRLESAETVIKLSQWSTRRWLIVEISLAHLEEDQQEGINGLNISNLIFSLTHILHRECKPNRESTEMECLINVEEMKRNISLGMIMHCHSIEKNHSRRKSTESQVRDISAISNRMTTISGGQVTSIYTTIWLYLLD